MTEEVWVYLGRRWSEGKIFHRYLDGDDKILEYGKILSGTTVGGRYRLKVTRKEDGGTSVVLKNYSYVGLFEDQQKIREWQAESQASMVVAEQIALEKKDGRSKIAEMTLTDLARLYRTVPATHGRALVSLAISIITSRTL